LAGLGGESVDHVRVAREALDHVSRLLAPQIDEMTPSDAAVPTNWARVLSVQPLLEFISNLSLVRSVDDIADAMIRSAVPALGASSGVLALLSDDRSSLRVVAATGQSAAALALASPIPLTVPVPLTAVIERGTALWFGRPEDLALQFPAVAAEVIGQSGALAFVPLWSDRSAVGVWTLRFEQPGAFLEEERDAINILARQCGATLAQLRRSSGPDVNDAEDVASTRRIAFLRNACDMLAAPLSADTRLNQVAELAVAGLADCCLLLCWQADRSLLQLSVAHQDNLLGAEIRERLREDWQAIATSAAFSPLLTGDEPTILSDYLQNSCEPLIAHPGVALLLAMLPTRSLIVAPVLVDGAHRGSLVLMSSRPERYGNGDIHAVATLARVIGMTFRTSLFPEAGAADQSRSLPHLTEFIMSAPIWLAFHDRDLRYAWVNQAVAALVGVPAAEFAGRSMAEMTPVSAQIAEPLTRRVLETGDAIGGIDLALPESSRPGVTQNATAYYFPVKNEQNESIGVGAALVPAAISSGANGQAQRQPAQADPAQMAATSVAQHERAAALSRTLDGVAEILSASTDYDAALEAIASQLVPDFGEFCIVHLLAEEDTSPTESFCYDVEPQRIPGVRRLAGRLYEARQQPFSPARVVSDGTLIVRNGQRVVLNALTGTGWREAVRQCGVCALAILPVSARDRALGTFTIGRRAPDFPFLPEEVEQARALSHLIGLSLDNVRLLQAARSIARLREEFLSIAAHELRTPLTSILGYTRLLTKQLGQEHSDRQHAVEISSQLSHQARRLDQLISDLLDISRIQQGHLELRLTPCDLVETVQKSVQRLVDAPEWTPTHRLSINAPSELLGNWDLTRIDQVVTNLVSNAVKYSPDGGRIVVSARGIGEIVELSVADQGIGIAAEDQARLFEPFTRSMEAVRGIPGVGLGLYIVSNIVHSHHGAIAVQSEPGQGTTVTVLLPRDPPKEIDD
jgi:signal transduction histidine kinase/PAS domain-containing protein